MEIMGQGQIVIVDSDAIIAIVNQNDSNHTKAMETLQFLDDSHVTLLFPATVISEVITTVTFKLQRKDLVKQIVSLLDENDIYPIGGEEIGLAIKLYDPESSKRHTFFDAVVAACAKQQKTVYIFSFDKWYKKSGFTLVSD
jgi:predicted nucleic acid-binding protein